MHERDNPQITQVEDDPKTQSDRPPRLLPISDAAATYRLIYHRVDALLRGRAEVAELTVPACPAWTIRQTVAHLVGVAQDVASLNLESKASDSWTQAQVDRLGGNSIDELLDLWGEAIDAVTAVLGQGASEGSGGQLAFDTLTHEHDIRGALGEPGSRTGDLDFQVAMGFLMTMGDQIIRQMGLPALRLATPTMGAVQLGDPGTAADQVSLAVSDFEALRVLGGRRSLRQLSALPWHGDPAKLLPALGNPASMLPALSDYAIRPPDDDLVD